MALRSFIEVAKDSHFPIQNIPFGIFKPRQGPARVGVAIGDYIVDLSVLEEKNFFKDLPPGTAAATTGDRHLFLQDSLNTFLELGRPAWRKAREILQHLLDAGTPTLRDDAKLRKRVFPAQPAEPRRCPAGRGCHPLFF